MLITIALSDKFEATAASHLESAQKQIVKLRGLIEAAKAKPNYKTNERAKAAVKKRLEKIKLLKVRIKDLQKRAKDKAKKQTHEMITVSHRGRLKKVRVKKGAMERLDKVNAKRDAATKAKKSGGLKKGDYIQKVKGVPGATRVVTRAKHEDIQNVKGLNSKKPKTEAGSPPKAKPKHGKTTTDNHTGRKVIEHPTKPKNAAANPNADRIARVQHDIDMYQKELNALATKKKALLAKGKSSAAEDVAEQMAGPRWHIKQKKAILKKLQG